MRFLDYQINEQVRRILARHWIDTSKLDYGTTNRVVYVRGVIHQIKARADQTHDREEQIRLITQIEKEIKRIPGNSGVVMKLEGFRKEGTQWKHKTS